MNRGISQGAAQARAGQWQTRPRAALCLCAIFGLSCAARADEPPDLPPKADRIVDFLKDIQPILAERCLSCHGPDKQQAGLRLDREGDALRGGDSGPAFEVGKSAQSLLIKYVAGLDPDILMPPEGEKLSAEQVGLLRAWIDQGAKWAAEAAPADGVRSSHWAFQPLARPPVPRVDGARWARNAIDSFVLARLEPLGIHPSPEAERRTLARRLALDLTGLPPDTETAESFAASGNEAAYEELVDRLLASPRFGERFGRHWLDLARYADSDGYEKDSPRPFAWRYRNWVIDAINTDMPFDQFTIQQIAGDLLPEATLEQKVATGFHRNTLTNKEGGVDQEEFRVAAVVDRVNTTATVWLGLTMACAQCHSHKYDPIVMREYYGLFAFFNQGQEVDLPAPTAQEAQDFAQARQRYEVEHAPFEQRVAQYERDLLPARQAEWERAFDPAGAIRWNVLKPAQLAAAMGTTLSPQEDGSVLASGQAPAADQYTFVAGLNAARLTALRIEALPDPGLPGNGPGRSAGGNFVLSEVRASILNEQNEETPIPIAKATADYSQEGYDVSAALDQNAKSGWGVAPQTGLWHAVLLELRGGLDLPAGARIKITLEQQHGTHHLLGRFRISATDAPLPVPFDAMPDEIPRILAIAPAERTAAQQAQLRRYYAGIDRDLQALIKARSDHARQAPAAPATLAQAFTEISPRRQTFLHIRGDFLRKGEAVEPHTPAILPPLNAPAGRLPDRLDLARWLVRSDNPLTPRVYVNRVWKQLFGQGLVATLEDFGTRGEPPSHPELLDWLAAEWIKPSEAVSTERAYGLKRLVRLIVTSATYRQSSLPRADLIERDPKNVLLARQNRLRVEAEVVRDMQLAVSGLLATRLGGPSVRPPQPAGISDLTYANSAKWVESQGADRYRRGMYTWFQRTSPYPMLTLFDAPDSNVTCTRRERSNTPLQSLALLNDPVFFECAQALGRKVCEEHPAEAQSRLANLFQTCLARPPTPLELTSLETIHADLRAAAALDLDAARALAGPAPPANPEALADRAAAVAMARLVMNLDEFVTRE
jgi:hypothetical protein